MSIPSFTSSVRTAAVALGLVAGVSVVAASPVLAAPPGNDDIGGATVLTVPTTISQDTSDATTSTAETALNDFCGAPTLAQGVWFTATPAQAGSVAIDVTGSDYSAGILVAQGSPGALQPLLCGPGAVSGFVEAGVTYYVLVFGDGLSAATSGNLVLETLVPPPPPSVDVTIDRVGSVDRAGVAHISGTVTCTSDDPNAILFDVSGDMRQRVGRFSINGFFFNELFLPCDGVTQRWQASVVGDNGTFAGGKAATVAFAFGCGTFDCGVGFVEQTVSLRRSGR